ncbi:ABC transporter permease [Petroclostridium sp. X23]|uniref:ABC transporter permease n=1 Tax=Petroclostridium sp. X23 TaxID=3045146 RepID=UPI0024AE22FA|nr:ABC transporter permease [Petroclostridium sp. X23]WHH57912.1 ABC transporter permease [Petroclostridium sp. X23]
MSAIMRLTFLEMLKKKILYLALAMTAVFFIFYGVALHYVYASLRNMEPLMKTALSGQLMSLGVYITGFIIAFLSVFASAGAISSEIEQGTYDAIATKPIPRYKLLIGRFLGIVIVLLGYLVFMLGTTVVLNVVIGHGVVKYFSLATFLKSLSVFALLPILLVSVGIFFSCSMSTMASGVTLVILYFCAMIGGILEQVGQMITTEAKHVISNIGIIISLIMPSDIIYRKASAVLFTTSSGFTVNLDQMLGGNTQPSNAMLIYIFIYIAAAVGLSIRKFGKRDL